MTEQERKRITFERFYRANVQDVWDLWTTKSGIESWWGPGGFAVTVRKLDLRPGGELLYAMTAIDPPQVEFMKKAGMPVTRDYRITFSEIAPPPCLRAPGGLHPGSRTVRCGNGGRTPRIERGRPYGAHIRRHA